MRNSVAYGGATRSAVGRDDVGIVPYGGLQEVRGRNPPVTATPCQPPLGKGAEGTGGRIATASVRTGLAMTGGVHGVRGNIRRADRGVRPYGSATKGAMGGRPQGSPLRKCRNTCVGRRALTPP